MGHLSIAARLVALCAVGVSAIPLRLASYYSPGVVLQRGAPVTIDGWASPGAPVTAALLNAPANASVFASTVASASDGSWAVTFPAQSAGTGWELFATTGADVERCASFAFYCTGPAVSVGNVAFGDVLGCFGQSNMQVNVAFAFNASAQTTGGGAAAVQYHLRYMTVSASAVSPRAVYDDFAVPPSQPWTAAGADTVGGVSATCYYSALSLLAARPAADAGVVLGLVISPWGGTPIKAHVPLSVNATCGALYPYSGGRNGDCGLDHAPCNVSAIFNAMLAPLAGPMGRPLASLLWFQGENDALATEQGLAYYACSLAALAAALRAAFASPNAHWVTFQLAAYNGGPALAPFRRMQCATTYADIPNSSCVVLADDGDWASPIGSVHSRNKQLVGRRAGAALADAIYGVPQPTRGRGPTFVSQELASAPDGTLTATVSIDPATLGPAGLIYSPPSTSPWSNATRCPLESGIFKLSDCGFLTIVTAAGAQLNATAAVDASGTKLILTASAGAGQTAVGTTHGWGAWPVINYYNEFGLPLVPWNVTGAA